MSTQPKRFMNATSSSDWLIEELPGLNQQDCSKLQKQGITTTRKLIKVAHNPQSKQALANQLKIQFQSVNKWVALAELACIPSIGCQYCGLLLHAGISSVSQLAQTPVHRLHQQILRLQVATMQRRDLCPPVDQVALWIQQARAFVVKPSRVH